MEKKLKTRFGEIAYTEDKIINFPFGLIGFEELKEFILLRLNEVFFALQSIQMPKIAFPLVEPEKFKKDYNFKISPDEKAILELEEGEKLHKYAIAVLGLKNGFSINLKAPILINEDKRIGLQTILIDYDYPTKFLVEGKKENASSK